MTFINIERASNYVHFWTKVLTDAVQTLSFLSLSTRRVFQSTSQCYKDQLEKYTKLLEAL